MPPFLLWGASMKMKLIAAGFSVASLAAGSALGSELLGKELLAAISGQSFDCVQGEILLEWHISEISKDVRIVPYTAVVRGKTVEAEYLLTDTGHLTSDGYGEERKVERAEDGTFIVTRSDGRAMTCKAQ